MPLMLGVGKGELATHSLEDGSRTRGLEEGSARALRRAGGAKRETHQLGSPGNLPGQHDGLFDRERTNRRVGGREDLQLRRAGVEEKKRGREAERDWGLL